MWVPSHCGIPGNEKVDAVAKAAANHPRINSRILTTKSDPTLFCPPHHTPTLIHTSAKLNPQFYLCVAFITPNPSQTRNPSHQIPYRSHPRHSHKPVIPHYPLPCHHLDIRFPLTVSQSFSCPTLTTLRDSQPYTSLPHPRHIKELSH